jgi:hypothetical protein
MTDSGYLIAIVNSSRRPISLRLKTSMQPQVLLRVLPNQRLKLSVDAPRIGLVVTAGEAF